MRARLGFATAIQVNPDVLLVDEVLGVGDEKFRAKSSSEMKKLIKSDKTVILASHIISTIKDLCDRVVWIENGLVRHIGEAHATLDLYVQKK
jgi:lipopolysaccharide transport system ATP-binding protein